MHVVSIVSDLIADPVSSAMECTVYRFNGNARFLDVDGATQIP